MSEATQNLLSTLPSPTGLPERRRAAIERLRETGFPGRKHEKWRFTSVREVAETPFQPALPSDDAAAVVRAEAVLGPDDSTRLFVVNGRPVAQTLPAGVRWGTTTDEVSRAGTLAPVEHFTALNAALYTEELLLGVAGQVSQVLHVVHVTVGGSEPVASYPRIFVELAPQSRLTLLETYVALDAQVLTNSVVEILVGEGAALDHTRITHGAEGSFHLGHVAVHLADRSTYESRVATFGGALGRVEIEVRMVGNDARVVLDGVYHVRGNEHVDHQLTVEHIGTGGESHVRYRGLLDGRGHAVFNAMSLVRKDAQRSSAHQENNNLLLSDDAIIDTKPHLEIEADDVSASHGATIGALDEMQLFYLRSRGMSADEARDLLTYAFVCEVLERIPHEATRLKLEAAVLARLPYGDRIRELTR